MDLPSERVKQVGDLRIVHNSWHTDWWLYKSIGSKIKCQRRVKRRRWTCLWLCERWGWDDHKAILLQLYVSYFHKRQFVIVDPRSGAYQNVSEVEVSRSASWGGNVVVDEEGDVSVDPRGAPPLDRGGDLDGVISDAKAGASYGTNELSYGESTGAGDQPPR